MKKSLTELFDCPISTLHIHFDIRTQLHWAIQNLQSQLDTILASPDCFSLENTEKRVYLSKAISRFQGNLHELESGHNTAIRELKNETHYEKDLPL